MEAECCGHNTSSSPIQIIDRIHNGRILPAHLRNHTLDPTLPVDAPGCLLGNPKAHGLGAGKRDEARVGVLHEVGAHNLPIPLDKVDDPRGKSDRLEQFQELVRDGGALLCRLHDDRVTCDHGGHNRPEENGEGKVPRSDHRTHPERDVVAGVVVGGLHDRHALAVADRLAGVVLEEVNRLGRVGIGLDPALADLLDHPGRIEVLVAPHTIGRIEEVGGAFRQGLGRPRWERGARRVEGALSLLDPTGGMHPDDLIRLRGVGGRKGRLEGHPLPTDDAGIDRAELALHAGDGLPQGRGVRRLGEVRQGLVDVGRA